MLNHRNTGRTWWIGPPVLQFPTESVRYLLPSFSVTRVHISVLVDFLRIRSVSNAASHFAMSRA